MKYEHIKKWFQAMRARPQMYTHTKEAFAVQLDTILRCHGYTTHHITDLVPRDECLPPPPGRIHVWGGTSQPVTNEFAEHAVDKAFDLLASGVIEE